MKMPATCSSDGHLMNVLERPQACGCTASECDGLARGTVVSKTAQTPNHTVEEDAGGCADAQAAPKVHHSNKSSRSDIGVRLAGDTQVIINQLPTRGNTMILDRLESDRRGPSCSSATTSRRHRGNKPPSACGKGLPGINQDIECLV